MSTNYYLRPSGTCQTQCSNWAHLGKSSVGWTFTFRAYPDPGNAPPVVTEPVTGFGVWVKFMHSGTVYDEYGREIPHAELLALIENKRGGRDDMYGSDFRDEAGNRFCPAGFS